MKIFGANGSPKIGVHLVKDDIDMSAFSVRRLPVRKKKERHGSDRCPPKKARCKVSVVVIQDRHLPASIEMYFIPIDFTRAILTTDKSVLFLFFLS